MRSDSGAPGSPTAELRTQHARPGPRLARRRDWGPRGGPLPGPRDRVGDRVRQHAAGRSFRRRLAAL